MLPYTFPTPLPTPHPIENLTERIAECYARDDYSLLVAHNKLQGILLELAVYQNMPTVINKWSVSLVEDTIKKHKLDRSSFDTDQIVQVLNQVMWNLICTAPEAKTVFIDRMQAARTDRDWLWQYTGVHLLKDHSLSVLFWALTEDALQQNGGIQIQNGILHMVHNGAKIEYTHYSTNQVSYFRSKCGFDSYGRQLAPRKKPASEKPTAEVW